jgi:hypothetical protein
MAQFAKLFELPDNNTQVQVTKHAGQELEDKPFLLAITTEVNNELVTFSPGWDIAEERDQYFDAFDQERAEHHFAQITEIVNKEKFNS